MRPTTSNFFGTLRYSVCSRFRHNSLENIADMTDTKLPKGEQLLIEKGLYVTLPLNMMILLTQSERDVLNAIRHCKNLGEHFISNSVLRIMTGLNEKTIRKARNKLIEMNIIEKGNTCSRGTEYRIRYSTLHNHISRLNQERNPVKRLILADSLRGKGREINDELIKEFKDSEFDRSL